LCSELARKQMETGRLETGRSPRSRQWREMPANVPPLARPVAVAGCESLWF